MSQPLDHAAVMAGLQQLDLVQLRADVAAKRAELERLEDFCRAVDVLQNGKKPRKTRNTRNHEGVDSTTDELGNRISGSSAERIPAPTRKPGRKSRAQRVVEVMQAHRLISAKRISELTGISESDVLYVLNNGFETTSFDMDHDGKWFIQ